MSFSHKVNNTDSKESSVINKFAIEDLEDISDLGQPDEESFIAAHKLLYDLTHKKQKTTIKDNTIVFKGEDLIKAYMYK